MIAPAIPLRPRHVHAIRKARLDVFVRDNFTCQYCGADLLRDVQTFYSATVDHIVPKCRGGTWDESNLASSCGGCNSLKGGYHAKSFEDGKAYVAAKRCEFAAYLKRLFAFHGIEVPEDRGFATDAREDLGAVLAVIENEATELIGLFPMLHEMRDAARRFAAEA